MRFWSLCHPARARKPGGRVPRWGAIGGSSLLAVVVGGCTGESVRPPAPPKAPAVLSRLVLREQDLGPGFHAKLGGSGGAVSIASRAATAFSLSVTFTSLSGGTIISNATLYRRWFAEIEKGEIGYALRFLSGRRRLTHPSARAPGSWRLLAVGSMIDPADPRRAGQGAIYSWRDGKVMASLALVAPRGRVPMARLMSLARRQDSEIRVAHHDPSRRIPSARTRHQSTSTTSGPPPQQLPTTDRRQRPNRAKNNDGAAQESNLPSLGLPDLTGFEDRLRHRPLPLRFGA